MFDDSTLQERMALAVKLGVAPAHFSTWVWVPPGPEEPDGKQVLTERIYWMEGGVPHSGLFSSLDEALMFLVKRYGNAITY